MVREASKVESSGAVLIPASMRNRFGLVEGTPVVVEEREDGILLRRATDLAVETYTTEREAEFLLNNAVDAPSYTEAVAEVRKMGLDPAVIPHEKPPGV